MPNTIYCPSCNRMLRVPDELVGKKVKCPSCGMIFIASAEGASPTAPSSPEEVFKMEPAPAMPRRPAPPGPPDYEEEPFEEEDYGAYPYRRGRAQVKTLLTAPAICLLVAAILGCLANLFQIVLAFLPKQEKAFVAQRPVGPPDPMQKFLEDVEKNSRGPVPAIGGLVGAAWCGVIILASIQMLRMRMWGLALTGSILSMLNCFNCCCLLGLPFGIWSVVVLSKPDVKSAFK